MLEGAASIFEGIGAVPTSLKGPGIRDLESSGSTKISFRGSCGSRQVLLHLDHGTTALLAVSAQAPDLQSAEQHDGSGLGSRSSSSVVISLAASCTQLHPPESANGQHAVLLQACQHSAADAVFDSICQSCSASACPQGCLAPCWLILYRVGTTLQLYAVQQQQQQQQQHQSIMQLLLELKHDSFGALGAPHCWLTQGPVMLLQPQPECLWLIVPSKAQQEPGTCTSASSLQRSWQLTELEVTIQDILKSLDLQFVQHIMQSRSAAAVPVLAAGSNSADSNSLAATRPWRLLHSQSVLGGMQLLLGMEVATVGPDGMSRAATKQQQQQQQQQVGLVVSLAIGVDRPCACPPVHEAVPGEAQHSMQVAHCFCPGWKHMPTCAAALQVEQRQQPQLVLIGSSAGALQLLACSVQQRTAQAAIWQQQKQHHQQRLDDHPGVKSMSASMQASGSVSGPVQDIQGLPQVLAGGKVCENAWAVLHSTSSSAPAASAGVVTLLTQQGSQLQAVAQVQGAAALIAPISPTTLGLLCPWQQQHTRQQQRAPDSSALQLAALIVLDELHEAADHISGLQCYARLGKQSPGSFLALIRQETQPCQQQQVAAAAAGQLNGIDGPPSAAAASELCGLQALLAGLEAHWQQEFLDLAALQHKLTRTSRVAASAHRQLCQLAADTVHGSSIRQHTIPINQLDMSAAVAAYQMGRQILQQQLAEQQVQLREWNGSISRWCVQLTLELVSCSSTLLPDKLQLVVCLKPVVQRKSSPPDPHDGHHYQQERLDSQKPACSSSSLGSDSWWGPLLQPCHAELLVWHAEVSPLTSQSRWHWDALAGVITVESAVPRGALLQLAMRQPAAVTRSSSGAAHKGACAAEAAGAADVDDDYAGVADAVAAAMTAGMDAPTASRALSSISTTSSGAAGGSVSLSAAVVVAACCRKQAVAQVECNIFSSGSSWFSSAHMGAATGRPPAEEAVLLRSRLLQPATALLHLPLVDVSTPQLLLQQAAAPVSAAAPASSSRLQQQADAQVLLGTLGGLHTPLHTGLRQQQQQQQQSGQVTPAAIEGSDPPPIPTGFTNADVIPPTPCDDDNMMYDDYQHEMVVADSEGEEEEPQAHTHIAATPAAAAVANGPAGDAAPTAAEHPSNRQQHSHQHYSQQHDSEHQRLLLLQGPVAVLQHVAAVLVQQFGFVMTLVTPALACSLPADQQAQLSALAAALRQQGAGFPRPVHVELQRLKDHASIMTDSNKVELVWLSSNVLHVRLSAGNSQGLDVLQQLMLLTVHSTPGGEAVTPEPSPLSPHRHASFLAATDALTQAVQLQCKVVEETLQQVQQQQQLQSISGAGQKGVKGATVGHHAAEANTAVVDALSESTDAAAGCGVIHVKQSAPDAGAAVGAGAVGALPADKDINGMLFVDGVPVRQSLLDCWVSLYHSQADVDLAISQLAAQS